MALLTVEGVYRDGMVELDERPPGLSEARVIVTFLADPGPEGLSEQERREAAQDLLESMRAGINFGGERFNREELYAERIDGIASRDR